MQKQNSLQKQVLLNGIAAVAIVEINAHGVVESLVAGPEIMDEVPAQEVALAGPVPTAVEGTRVASFKQDVADFVGLEAKIVAAVKDGVVGGVVDEIVEHGLTAAADLNAGGVGAFLVVDGQREEVLTFLDALGGRDGAEHDSFAIGGEDRAVSLTGNAAGFQGEGLSAPLHAYGFDVEHFISFSPQALLRAGFAAGVYRPGPV